GNAVNDFADFDTARRPAVITPTDTDSAASTRSGQNRPAIRYRAGFSRTIHLASHRACNPDLPRRTSAGMRFIIPAGCTRWTFFNPYETRITALRAARFVALASGVLLRRRAGPSTIDIDIWLAFNRRIDKSTARCPSFFSCWKRRSFRTANADRRQHQRDQHVHDAAHDRVRNHAAQIKAHRTRSRTR